MHWCTQTAGCATRNQLPLSPSIMSSQVPALRSAHGGTAYRTQEFRRPLPEHDA